MTVMPDGSDKPAAAAAGGGLSGAAAAAAAAAAALLPAPLLGGGGGKLVDSEGGAGSGGGGASGATGNSSLSLLMAKYKIPLIVLYYGLCSSTLIVVNKVAVSGLRAPTFILILQLAFAAGTVRGLSAADVLEAEPLRWALVRPFLMVVFGFLGTLFANIKVLVYSNVETFITFRSSTPLVLSLFDYLLLGRELPGGRSVASLVLLVVSCAGYTYYDQGFRLEAYVWLCVWYCFFCFEACYVKFMCDTVRMTNWGRVYYTNLLSALALLLAFPACATEHALLRAHAWTQGEVALLLLSCLIGVCMSHAGYLMRSNVSATAGVVVGVVCKIGSVALNLVIWDQHASGTQLAFLSLGLLGGALFKQAPLRPSAKGAARGGGGSGGGSGGGGGGAAPLLLSGDRGATSDSEQDEAAALGGGGSGGGGSDEEKLPLMRGVAGERVVTMRLSTPGSAGNGKHEL